MTLLRRLFNVAPAALSRALQGEPSVTISPKDAALVEAELEKPPRPRQRQSEAPPAAPAPSSAPPPPVAYSRDGKRSL